MSELDAVLDEAVAAKDTAAWHEHRSQGFGCSDLPALWKLLGWVSQEEWGWTLGERANPKTGKMEDHWTSDQYREGPTGEREYRSPRYLLEQTLVMKRCGLPRLIAEKAGKAKGRAQSDAMAEGKHKERALFQQSRLGRFDTRAFYAPDTLCPARWDAQVVGGAPLVLRDTVEPRMLCTVEAWEETAKGTVAWELKTDRPGIREKPPWYQRVQALGQAVVLGADAWGIQYGPRWALTDDPAFPDLADPIQWGPFVVRDEDRAMFRRGVRLGWQMVDAALGGQKAGTDG